MDEYELFNVNRAGSTASVFSTTSSVTYEFKLGNALEAAAQRCIVPMRINKTAGKLEVLDELADRSVINKTFAPRERVMPHNPDTLDDPDIEQLLLTGGAQPTYKEVPVNGEIINTTLVVLKSSISIAGSANYFRLHGQVTDCKTIRHDKPEFIDDTLLITTADNILYSVVFNDNLEPQIVHWWALAKPTKALTWKIIIHPEKDRFMLYEKETSAVKFFKLQNSCPYYVELVRNMHMLNTKILACSYLFSKSEAIVFISGLKASRIYYYLVTWPIDSVGIPEVHQFVVPDGKVLEDIIPLNNNYCLAISKKTVDLFSVHQLLTSESHGIPLILEKSFGTITHFEYDVQILSRLQQLDTRKYLPLTRAVIFSTSIYLLGLILADDRGTINFYGLTRFKGLKGFTLVPSQPQSAKAYKLQIISFGKVFEITLDLSGIAILDDRAYVESMSNILRRHTKDTSFAYAEELISFRDKTPAISGTIQEELWSCSSSVLSNISTNGHVAHFKNILYLREFLRFNSIWTIGLDAVAEEVYTRLCGDDRRYKGYLVIGSDGATITRAFVLYFSSEEDMECDEVDGILSDLAGATIYYFVTNNYLVQVTKRQLLLSSVIDERDRWNHDLPFVANGALSLGPTVVFWAGTQISYIENVELMGRSHAIATFDIGNSLRSQEALSHLDLNGLLADELFHIEKVLLDEPSAEWTIKINCLFLVYKFMASDSEPTLVRLHLESASAIISDTLLIDRHTILCSDATVITPSHNYENAPRAVNTHKIKGYYSFEPFGERGILCYSASEIFLYDLKHKQEIKLPGWKKNNSIIQVCANQRHVLVLFSDGLGVYENSYQSYTGSNIVLSSTHCAKRFIYISSINRLLIVTCKKKSVECMKLESRKQCRLETHAIFADVDEILDVKQLGQVTADASPSSPDITLAFSCRLRCSRTSYIVKVVLLIPAPGRLTLRLLTATEFPELACAGEIRTGTGNTFWVATETGLVQYSLQDMPDSPQLVLLRMFPMPLLRQFDTAATFAAALTTDGRLHLLLPDGSVCAQDPRNTARHDTLRMRTDGSVLAYTEPLAHGAGAAAAALVLYYRDSTDPTRLCPTTRLALSKTVTSIHLISDVRAYLLHSDGTVAPVDIEPSSSGPCVASPSPASPLHLASAPPPPTNNIGIWDIDYRPVL
ncbi:FABR181Wp [Eremothecium gossypii FDAG1]|nr:FABR181Wp [Eremothecium gossypii FDAG1]